MTYDPWGHHEQRFPAHGVAERLTALKAHFEERSAHYLGFPNSRLLTFSALADFLRFNINNIGDPYQPNGGINTCAIEQEVIAFWAQALHLESARGWGYITNGSTEAIMYGLAQGRDRYDDAVLLFSEQSHYCLPKIAHLLRLPHRVIPSHADGTLDLDALNTTLTQLDGRPCILNLTVGTTFHGAIESPQQALELLEQRHCRDVHLHVDAALYGPMLCWIADAPLFDFRLPIHTLSFSGHKFLGAPIPCGLVLSHRDPIQPFAGSAEYVGSVDTTLSSSRDGFCALVLWLVIQQLGRQGLAALAAESLQMAAELVSRLQQAGITASRHRHGCIVVVPRPDPALARRWQLATCGDFAHIVTVPGVTPDMVDRFIGELLDPATPPAAAPPAATPPATTARP